MDGLVKNRTRCLFLGLPPLGPWLLVTSFVVLTRCLDRHCNLPGCGSSKGYLSCIFCSQNKLCYRSLQPVGGLHERYD